MKCEICDNEHDGSYGSGRFCSMRCARRFSTLLKRKEISIKISKSMKGKLTGIAKARKEGTYIWTEEIKKSIGDARKRYAEKVYAEYIKNWLNDKETGYSGSKKLRVHPSIKWYLLKVNNNKCEICSWGEINPFTGKLTLQLHHKDGDRTNCKKKNIQLICPNCHSLTKTFGYISKYK